MRGVVIYRWQVLRIAYMEFVVVCPIVLAVSEHLPVLVKRGYVTATKVVVQSNLLDLISHRHANHFNN